MFFVFLAGVAGLVGQHSFTRLVLLDHPPAVLANKGQERLGRFSETSSLPPARAIARLGRAVR